MPNACDRFDSGSTPIDYIKQLAKGGEDTLRNAVALCPNCHRKMHSLNKKADVKKLTVAASDLGAYT